MRHPATYLNCGNTNKIFLFDKIINKGLSNNLALEMKCEFIFNIIKPCDSFFFFKLFPPTDFVNTFKANLREAVKNNLMLGPMMNKAV